MARSLVNAGSDIVAIKDMAGLLRPYAAELLIRELREVIDVPIHFHTHDTAGGQIAAYLKASEAGVDIVDCAFSSMSGVTSQPALEALVAALENSERDTEIDFRKLTPFSVYWESVREVYAPFESDLKSATSEVYVNEIPGGQYSNFRPQAESLGLGSKWSELKQAYAEADKLFGGIVKVTPSSKVVGDLALFMVANGLSSEDVLRRAAELDFPASVVEFLAGELGEPYGGFPEPFRTNVLRGKQVVVGTVAERLPPADFEKAKEEVSQLLGEPADICQALSYLLYPNVFKDYAKARSIYGTVSQLPTVNFLYGMLEGEELEVDIEAGKKLIIKLVSVGDPEPTGDRVVSYELNGQSRSILIKDRMIVPEVIGNEKADSSNSSQAAAPLSGALVGFSVKLGDSVKRDEPLFTIEAMKMQTIVRAVRDGVISRLVLPLGSRVSVGDLVLEFSKN